MENSRENSDRLRAAFFNNALEAFVIFDKELNCLESSQSYLDLFHFKREDIVGKHISAFIPGIKEAKRYRIYQKVIRTGKAEMIDEVVPHPSLGNYCVRVYAFKVKDGLGVAAMNITDLREAIEDLNIFSYKASHDMRSPLATIMGLVNVADQTSKDLEAAMDYLEMIKHQAERMDGVLKELIDFIRITSGKKKHYLINFRQLVDEVLESLSGMEGYHDIYFEKHIFADHKFYSDKALLVSMFQNLIDNAIKYRKKHLDTPWVKVSVTDDQQGVKICVADNGIGIEPEYQNDVFNMFFRATNLVDGIGLGLYSVQHCVNKLGGDITLESDEEGTAFTIFLPDEKEAQT